MISGEESATIFTGAASNGATVVFQVFKIVTERRNTMSGGENHKGGKRRFTKFRRAADGNFSLAEKIERKNLGRLARKIICIELSGLDQFGGQFERNGFHVCKLADIRQLVTSAIRPVAPAALPTVFFVS